MIEGWKSDAQRPTNDDVAPQGNEQGIQRLKMRATTYLKKRV